MSYGQGGEAAGDSPLKSDVTPKTLAAVIGGLLAVIVAICAIATIQHNREQKQLVQDFNLQRNREAGIPIPAADLSSADQAAETLQHNEDQLTQQRDAAPPGQ